MSYLGSRSRVSSAREKRKQTLENLKKARNSHGTRTELHDLKEEENVYDVLNDDEYGQLVEERRQKDDFVIDDDGLGYADDGEEHLGVADDERTASKNKCGSDEESESRAVRKARKLNKAAAAHGIQKNTMFNFVRSGQANTHRAVSENTVDEIPDIDDLLGDFAKPSGSARKSSSNMRDSRGYASTVPHRPVALTHSRNLSNYSPSYLNESSSVLEDHADDYDNDTHFDETQEMVTQEVEHDEEINESTPTNQLTDQAIIESKQDIPVHVTAENPASDSLNASQRITLTKTNKKLKLTSSPPTQEEKSVEAVPATEKFKPVFSASSNNEVAQGLAAIGEVTGLTSISDKPGAIDPRWWLQRSPGVDGQDSGKEFVAMYWTDATEINGVVYLFGKIPVQPPTGPKRFESCCVAVHGMQRNLFVLARGTGEVDNDGNIVRAGLADVHKDLTKLLVPSIIPKEAGQGFRCKAVMRKYAFEHEEVPRDEQQYLKVVYSAKFGSPSPSACSGQSPLAPNIERIFGAASSPLELFLLKRKLMGPSWIVIHNPRTMPDPVSWCRIEIGVENPKLVVKMSVNDAPPAPPLVTMSVSMKTAVNPTSHLHEVIGLSAVVHTKVDMDGETDPSPQHMRRFTMIRQLGGSCGKTFPSVFPHNLRAEASKACGGTLILFTSERELLLEFFKRLHAEDPDLLASHNLFGFEFDVLLNRAVVNKIPSWSKIGRLQRSRIPKSISDKDLAAGRLLCDTYKAAKEFLRETTYSLSHLSQSQLSFDRAEVDPVDVPKYFTSAMDIIRLANHTAWDSLLVLRLMIKLQVVPLTKQLTNLSGNLWARTMRGARAERIEFLLLHEFYSLKYILPEKKAFENKKGAVGKTGREAEEEEEEIDDGKVGGRARVRAKAAYAGGLVLEPKKGLYDTFILLLDFNSLYPSIIQEHNMCFTTIPWTKYMPSESITKEVEKSKKASKTDADRHEDEDEDDDVAAADTAKALPPLPPSNLSQGVLPRVIKYLVDRRKVVKGLLKKERDPSVCQQLDIKQKALKLTANSMYGCLGFTFSRFYARPIAALVTAMGREALQRTVDLSTNQLGLEVIYGDTDSVMINTASTDLNLVKELGGKVTKEVNKLYRCLELDIDGIFKSMLLLKKKKYAALCIKEVDGQLKYEKEMKGLDLVRRDWCPLSKDTGKYVVEQILSGRPRDDIVINIHEYLSTLATSMREGKEDIAKFIITKGLNKSPKDYPDCKGQPHLQVALQMLKNNRPVNIGDHIPYVICAPKEGEDALTPAQRANHPDDILRSGGLLTVDTEWYLSNQILPPISRLCEPIEGTSQAQLAIQLGLDATKFHTRVTNDEVLEEGWGYTPQCKMKDIDRFKDCLSLIVTCKVCKYQGNFVGPVSETGVNGMCCSTCGAKYLGRKSAQDFYCYMSNVVTRAIRKYQKDYYNYYLVCDDHSCNKRTMHQSAMGYMCTENCHGKMIQEYCHHTLHTQLKYFETRFDLPRLAIERPDLLNSFSNDDKEVLSLLKEHMANTVKGSAYNWIRPSLWTTMCGTVPTSTDNKVVSGM